MNTTCSAVPCPVILNATCVFYEGANLIYTGINTNDNLQTALQKIDDKFYDANVGYIFENGIVQSSPGQPVKLGGSLTANTTINSAGFTFALSGTIESQSFITTGGTSSQFVKGNGSLDSTSYQPVGNYITALTGDGTASGPGSATFTLSTTGVIANIYGDSTHVPKITVDAKGRITNVTSTLISVPSALLLFSGDVSGTGMTGANVTLTLNTINANVYAGNNFLKFGVNGKGLVTSASPVNGTDINLALGYVPVPQTRTLTINGITYNLSANRSWTIVGTLPPQATHAGEFLTTDGTNASWVSISPGGVSSVTASSPLFSSGGTAPNITIQQSSGSQAGYLSSADWTTFNSKEPAIAAGTTSQYWRGDKTWQTFPTIPTVTPSALTKIDDTNVTLTLGGSPNTSLLAATSLTLGWAGTLADSRITSASTWNAKQDAISLTTTGTSGAATFIANTLNIPQYTDQYVGTVTSVGLSMPSAFTVTNSPVTSSGTLTVAGAGTASQYIRGDGSLATFATTGGGGSSVNYYLNGSVNQGIFGGDTYYQLSKTPILAVGTNFTRTNIQGDGYIASFITDAGDPNLINIPGGNWTLEFYFNASSIGGSPAFYGEIYKVSALNVFTLIASSSVNPEAINNGTSIDQYFTSVSVPTTTLVVTDRIAIRIYVITSGKTITLHTENSNLSEVITTFSTGVTALNGLIAQVQYFATGTSGTDFAISSITDTHTFNLPTASATNRGALSSADWTTFNGKVGGSGTSGQVAYWSGTNTQAGSNNLFWDSANNRLGIGTAIPAYGLDVVGDIQTSTKIFNGNGNLEVGADGDLNYNSGNGSHIFNGAISIGTGVAPSAALDVVGNAVVTGKIGVDATPTSKLQVNTNANSVTQSDANGLLLANATNATVGLQSISPPVIWQGNGWKTNATAASQDVRFRADVLPVQGTANPFATWRLGYSVNGAAYTNIITADIAADKVTLPVLVATQTSSISALVTGTSSSQVRSYKLTNAGGNVNANLIDDVSNVVAGTLSFGYDKTNQLSLLASNGSLFTARAGIQITNLDNTAGSEDADLIFLTQAAGAAMAERLRISNTGVISTDGGTTFNPGIRVSGTNVAASTQLQALGQSVAGTYGYRTTNGGSNVNPVIISGSNLAAAGALFQSFDVTNQFVLGALNNASIRIARAAMQITNLDNTAGSEDADLIFLTQAAGLAMAERLRISNVGALKASAYGSGTITGTPTYTLAVDATGNIIETTVAGGGGINRSINNISINTTAGASASTDYVYLISGTTTLTLPTAVGNTNRYTLKNTGINTVTINTTSSQTIDGSTSITMAVRYTAVDVISDGTNWNII